MKKEKQEKLYELWFRYAFKQLIVDKKMTAAIRPGRRLCPAPKCTNEGDLARIKILKKPGDEEKGLMPIFDDYETIVKIEKIIVKPLKELTAKDLQKCSPDSQTPKLAKYQLSLIYNKEFTDDEIISIVHFKYI